MPSSNDAKKSGEAAKRKSDAACDAISIDCPNCRFDLDVGLIGNDDGDILTPMKVPAYSELGCGKTKSLDFVKFKLEIKQNPVARLTVEIYTEGSRTDVSGGSTTTVSYRYLLYRQDLGPEYRDVGSHEWRWDGFSSFGILDTEQLKDPSLTLEATAELCRIAKSKKLKLDNSSAEEDWVDIRVDRGAKTVAATIRVKLDDNGANGVGEMAPKPAQQTRLYQSFPAGHDATKPHQRLRSYAALKGLVHAGMKNYWSRKLDAIGYSLTVNAVETQAKHMDDIGVEYNTNAAWMRSSNPGKVRGFYSFFGNFVPERAVYNVGWIEYEDRNGRKVWSYDSDVSADRDFSRTSAHELGHEILSAYGGDEYSYGHRGSSTVITQETKELSSGGVSYPASGEIDLMKYYNGTTPPDFYVRSVVSEVDAQSLIWLARVKFDD